MIGHQAGVFDNGARDHRRIRAVPLAAAMGAEIRGVDLGALDDETFAEIEDALFRHKMIFFRDQAIGHGDQEAFSLRFGPFAEDAYTGGVEGHVDVQPVIREADQPVAFIFGAGWHTDSPFLERPPAISMLRGVDVPPWGGDTMWANAALAYAALSPTMRRIVDPLRVHMSMANVLAMAQRTMEPGDSPLGRLAATRDGGPLPDEVARKVAGTVHPLVRTHPRTGERALYCDPTYAVGIDGLTDAEARPLLDFLVAHITQPAFTCRLRWEPNTVALWDNRSCVHQAFNDHDGFRREMYRTTVAGDVPA